MKTGITMICLGAAMLCCAGWLWLDVENRVTSREPTLYTVPESIIQHAAHEGFAFGYMAANGWTNYNETTLSSAVHWTLTNKAPNVRIPWSDSLGNTGLAVLGPYRGYQVYVTNIVKQSNPPPTQ